MSRLEDDLRATLSSPRRRCRPRRWDAARGSTTGPGPSRQNCWAGRNAGGRAGSAWDRRCPPPCSPIRPRRSPHRRRRHGFHWWRRCRSRPTPTATSCLPADGALVRRAPDGTTTSWVTRGDLNGACDVPGCELYDLVWSPDGSTLALTMGKIQRLSPSRLAVYVLADGATQPRKVLDCPEAICLDMQSPSLGWSPDGASLVISGDDFGTGLVVADVDESAAEARTVCEDCPATDAAWSPDGRWIAYASDDGIRRISTSGGPSELVSPEGGSDLTWSPDGTRLLFDPGSRRANLDLSRRPTPKTRSSRRQTAGEGPAGTAAWSPDGTRVLWFSTPSETHRQVRRRGVDSRLGRLHGHATAADRAAAPALLRAGLVPRRPVHRPRLVPGPAASRGPDRPRRCRRHRARARRRRRVGTDVLAEPAVRQPSDAPPRTAPTPLKRGKPCRTRSPGDRCFGRRRGPGRRRGDRWGRR